MKVEFNKEILGQLLYRYSDKEHAINVKFPKIQKWKQGESSVTINQLSKLANYFHIPFGYFFLDKLPLIKYPVPHYRSGTSSPNTDFKPSDELLETIKIIEARQNWARDLRKEFNEKLDFAGSIALDTDIKEAAAKVRKALKIPIDWSKNEIFKKWGDRFGFLVSKAEEAGIFVAINGVVNNDNRRKLKVDEFRGFVLHDNYAPFIFINNNDFVSGKVFTIMHEIVHVFVGKSASFENKELLPSNAALEKFCDKVAAEFLVPENLLLEEWDKSGSNYEKLTSVFKVSRMVIARRLYDLEKIAKPDFDGAYKNFKSFSYEKKDLKTNGGNFYYTTAYRVGRSFFNLIYSSVKQDKILYRDAFRLTSLKPKTFDGYVNKILSKP